MTYGATDLRSPFAFTSSWQYRIQREDKQKKVRQWKGGGTDDACGSPKRRQAFVQTDRSEHI